MGRLGCGGPEAVRGTHRHAPDGNPARHCACCHVPGFGLCFLDHRPDPSGDGIAELNIRAGVAMTEQKPLEPWQWPEEHWRKLVNQVRAGRALRPKTWKNGARCAFAISFDSDHETNELRDGGKSIGRMAWGQYGNRVGAPRILRLLARYEVPATFYVPAVSALLYPDEQRRVVAEGHEIGIHGWIHELNSTLSYDAERDLMLRSAS